MAGIRIPITLTMKKIFLVAPYSIDADYPIKKDALMSLCSSKNWKLLIAEDEQTGGGLSASTTVKLLKECDFAIADLSYERPSCYYEIGFLQALEKRVYMICKSGTSLHQVLHSEQVRPYSDLDSYYSIVSDIMRNEFE